MRKFKYLHSKRIEKKLLKKRIDLLNPEARKRFKSNQLFSRVFAVLYWSIMIVSLGAMIFLERYIEPAIGKTLFIILVIFESTNQKKQKIMLIEFKAFIMGGNVIEFAVAVIMATAISI